MSKPIQIAINGFGRIGRKIARLAINNDNINIIAINDSSSPETMVHLLKYDSVHGRLDTPVHVEGDVLVLGRHRIKLLCERDANLLPWKALGVDIVHECTGHLTEKETASAHLKAGAKRVIISAPSKNSDATFCMGVNEETYNPALHTIVSNASCTTNCLAPVAKVLDQAFGIVRGTMMTVHAYTNDQNTLDRGHKDIRRARAAAVSMIPTSTGAAKAVGLVLPHLKGKIDGQSVRVPTPNVSMVDFTVELSKSVTKEEINNAFKTAANGPLKGILAFETDPLVSVDFNGSTMSSTVDAELTQVINAGCPTTMAKVIAWYDNESGFSQRMLDLSLFMARKGI